MDFGGALILMKSDNTDQVEYPGNAGNARQLPRDQIRILVIDDIPDARDMLTVFLSQCGFQVTSVESGGDALQTAIVKKFDLIISDVGLPHMNGFEVARRLRRLKRYKNTPIIAVTGYSEYEDGEKAVQSGFTTLLTKPVDPFRLLALIEKLLGL